MSVIVGPCTGPVVGGVLTGIGGVGRVVGLGVGFVGARPVFGDVGGVGFTVPAVLPPDGAPEGGLPVGVGLPGGVATTTGGSGVVGIEATFGGEAGRRNGKRSVA